MAPSVLAALLFVEAPIAPSELHLYVRNDHDPARTAAAAELFVDDCEAHGTELRQGASTAAPWRETSAG
jgi:hypothetical protein